MIYHCSSERLFCTWHGCLAYQILKSLVCNHPLNRSQRSCQSSRYIWECHLSKRGFKRRTLVLHFAWKQFTGHHHLNFSRSKCCQFVSKLPYEHIYHPSWCRYEFQPSISFRLFCHLFQQHSLGVGVFLFVGNTDLACCRNSQSYVLSLLIYLISNFTLTSRCPLEKTRLVWHISSQTRESNQRLL